MAPVLRIGCRVQQKVFLFSAFDVRVDPHGADVAEFCRRGRAQFDSRAASLLGGRGPPNAQRKEWAVGKNGGGITRQCRTDGRARGLGIQVDPSAGMSKTMSSR